MPVRYPAFVIVDLIGMRQGDDLLGVETAMLGWDDDLVGDDIVHLCRTHRAGISEVIDLDRRGASCGYPDPRTSCETCQVDKNIDPLRFDQLCRLLVGELLGVDAFVECP